MSIRRRAGVVAIAVLPVLPVQGAPAAPDAVPFTLGDGGAVIVPVFVDGQGPHSFLVDTGANRSAVIEGLAARLGLAPVAKSLVVTPAGDETRVVVRLGRVSVGTATAEGLLASVLAVDRRWLDGADVAGILGQDFLARFDYTIDYRRRRVVWGGEPGAASVRHGVRLELHPSEGRFLVELPQPEDAGRAARFVPDTGTNGLVMFERPGGVRLSSEPLSGGAELSAASGGRRTVRMRRIRSLRVGNLTLHDQVAAIVTRPETDAPETDGLLPLHQFASVTFGSRDGYLVIRP
jgi:aspartyl protease